MAEVRGVGIEPHNRTLTTIVFRFSSSISTSHGVDDAMRVQRKSDGDRREALGGRMMGEEVSNVLHHLPLCFASNLEGMMA